MPQDLPLTSDFSRDDAIPYFLWDEPLTVAEFRDRLRGPDSARFLGKLLREARDTDVWKFTTPEEVAARWSDIEKHLGRRRPFWEWLFRRWREEGLLAR